MTTLLLSRTQVARYLDATSLVRELREALRRGPQPDLAPVRTTRVRGSSGELLHVQDREGRFAAALEATRALALQRALVGAVAVDALASPAAAHVALVGASTEASVQLKSVRLVRSLKSVTVFDEDPVRAHELSSRLYLTLGLPARVAGSLQEAVGEAELALLTESRGASLFPGMVNEGAHVNAVSHRAAFAPSLIAQSTLYTDEPAASAALPLREAFEPGWRRPPGVTLFSSADPPFLDAVSAWHVLQAAEQDAALARFDFSGTSTDG